MPNNLSPFKLAMTGGVFAVIGFSILIAQYFVDVAVDADPMTVLFTKIIYALSMMFYGIPIIIGVVCFGTLWVISRPVKVIQPEINQPLNNYNPELRRRTAYREFWITLIDIAKAHEDVIAWKVDKGWSMNDIEGLEYGKWLTDFITPFAVNGWAKNAHQGKRTELIRSSSFILSELNGGNLPPLPLGESIPPKLKAQAQEAAYA